MFAGEKLPTGVKAAALILLPCVAKPQAGLSGADATGGE